MNAGTIFKKIKREEKKKQQRTRLEAEFVIELEDQISY